MVHRSPPPNYPHPRWELPDSPTSAPRATNNPHTNFPAAPSSSQIRVINGEQVRVTPLGNTYPVNNNSSTRSNTHSSTRSNTHSSTRSNTHSTTRSNTRSNTRSITRSPTRSPTPSNTHSRNNGGGDYLSPQSAPTALPADDDTFGATACIPGLNTLATRMDSKYSLEMDTPADEDDIYAPVDGYREDDKYRIVSADGVLFAVPEAFVKQSAQLWAMFDFGKTREVMLPDMEIEHSSTIRALLDLLDAMASARTTGSVKAKGLFEVAVLARKYDFLHVMDLITQECEAALVAHALTKNPHTTACRFPFFTIFCVGGVFDHEGLAGASASRLPRDTDWDEDKLAPIIVDNVEGVYGWALNHYILERRDHHDKRNLFSHHITETKKMFYGRKIQAGTRN